MKFYLHFLSVDWRPSKFINNYRWRLEYVKYLLATKTMKPRATATPSHFKRIPAANQVLSKTASDSFFAVFFEQLFVKQFKQKTRTDLLLQDSFPHMNHCWRNLSTKENEWRMQQNICTIKKNWIIKKIRISYKIFVIILQFYSFWFFFHAVLHNYT